MYPGKTPVRVMRLIARMNLGGPAHHVALLGERMDPDRYETLLVTGVVGRGEEEFDCGAVSIRRLDTLGPDIRPVRDLRALVSLVRLVRTYRPDIVETHTSKAGMLGRVAAILALRKRPVIVHTYHGHVLRGYFGPLKSRVFTAIERALARTTDVLLAVSPTTVDELVDHGVAPRSKFAVVPLGLDLEPFLSLDLAPDGAVREEAGAAPGDMLFTYVGRLVPIKRPEVMLRALALAREHGAQARIAVVGDGELRPALEELSRTLGCADFVRFLGYRRDLGAIAAASDAALLSSDNEGTPVALIEAAAAGRPAVATAVGGVRDVVVDGAGLLAPPGDVAALAGCMVRLTEDPELRIRMGERAREHVRGRFTAARLLSEMDSLYTKLLAEKP
jgi:glycosyltransferase involved in cell wall biosynthesis